MISDRLADAVLEMDRYTKDPKFASKYNEPETAQRIANVRAAMITLSAYLDKGVAVRMRGLAK
jgi:hypothetical protein